MKRFVRIVPATLGALVVGWVLVSVVVRAVWEQRRQHIDNVYVKIGNVLFGEIPRGAQGTFRAPELSGAVVIDGKPLTCWNGHSFVWTTKAPSGELAVVLDNGYMSPPQQSMFVACCSHAHSDGGRYFVFQSGAPATAYQADEDIGWFYHRMISYLSDAERRNEDTWRAENGVHPMFSE